MNNPKPILAIDTSCDDTSAAVTVGLEVWSNVIASQTELHKKYGGVFPTVAKQAHRDKIQPVIQEALKRAGVTWNEIGGVAVTQGPGLAPALEIGIAAAKEWAENKSLPLYAVNHIEGHLLSPLAQPKKRSVDSQPTTATQFPALGIIVSGGHTELIEVKSIGEYSRLGHTLDDAAGEALDKIGRLLGLGYPAGATIEEFAKKGDAARFDFPLPMRNRQDAMFSFSGLKTHARKLIEELEKKNQLDKQATYDFAAATQEAIFAHIIDRARFVLETSHPNYFKEMWLGGGVAANMRLRQLLRKNFKIPLKAPYSKRLCQDNAAMIGMVVGLREDLNPSTNFERSPRFEM